MPISSSFTANHKLIEALEQRAQPVFCPEDCILFSQGEPPRGIFIIVNGNATLSMKSPSGELLLNLAAGAGSLLGLPGVVGKEPYSLTAIAQRGAEIRFIASNDFEALIQAEPSLSFGVCQVLAAEVQTARRALANL